LEIGDIVDGIVAENAGEHKEVTLTLLNANEEDIAIIPAEKSGPNRYKKGRKVLLRVIGIHGNERTGYEITCEPVEI